MPDAPRNQRKARAPVEVEGATRHATGTRADARDAVDAAYAAAVRVLRRRSGTGFHGQVRDMVITVTISDAGQLPEEASPC